MIAAAADEWQLVQIRKKGPKSSKSFSSNGRIHDENLPKNKHNLKYEQHGPRRKSNSSETTTILASTSTDLLISKIENYIHSLQQSSLFASICEAIDSVANAKFQSIICLGIGNFSTSSNCLLQMSLYIYLRKKYLNHENICKTSEDDTETNFNSQSFIYDPMLTEIERSVCFKLGISVCEENLHGQHKIPSSTDEEANGKVLFFLPHCPYQLYCNLLWTNVSELNRIYILGNSFQSYMLRRLYYCGETKTKIKTATIEESGNRSSDISLFAEYFNENELWNSFASSLSSQEKRRMVIVMMKGGDSNTTTIDFAALEAAFCDTSFMYPKCDGKVSDIIKYKPLQEELKLATENDLEMI